MVSDQLVVPLVTSTGADWWHRFATLLSLRLPDLAGKTVLAVGPFDGYFSFAAERLGALHVVAVDTNGWRLPGSRDAFQRVKQSLASSVDDVEIEVLDIRPETVGCFDVVLFVGALDHARHPLLALERMASVTTELAVVETATNPSFVPAFAARLSTQYTVREEKSWRGLNRATVAGMLHAVGFREVVAHPVGRFSIDRLAGLPARAKNVAGLRSSTGLSCRRRLLRDFLKSTFIETRLVAHSWR